MTIVLIFSPVLIAFGWLGGQMLARISLEAHLVRVEREKSSERRMTTWGNPTVARRMACWL
ncbi:MAG: hypothetical protein V4674_01330 [Patescibacteria group bacterium]